MAVNKRTCLSAGVVVSEILTQDAGVRAITKTVFPIVSQDAVLPYIAYRRTQLATEALKARASDLIKTGRSVDTTCIEVTCYGRNYKESVELGEAVRAALDCRRYESKSGIVMRDCHLTDGEEYWADDAFVQQLIFEIKI